MKGYCCSVKRLTSRDVISRSGNYCKFDAHHRGTIGNRYASRLDPNYCLRYIGSS